MTPVSELVVQNAIDCLDILGDDFELDMRLYNIYCNPVEEENVCNTTFCLAGWQAHKENYPEEYFMSDGYFNYTYFSRDKVEHNWNIWNFFYSSNWCNDKEYAKERMRFVIENRAIPKVIIKEEDDNLELVKFEGWPWSKSNIGTST